MFKIILSLIRIMAHAVLSILFIFGLVSGQIGLTLISLFLLLLSFLPEIINAIHSGEVSDKSKITPLELQETEFKAIFKSLDDFDFKISEDKDICDFVRRHIIGNIQVNGDDVGDPQERIGLLMDLDVVYCYLKLGIAVGDNAQTRLLESYKNNHSPSYFTQLAEARAENPDSLYLAHCLRNVDMDYCREYCSLLLSFSRELMKALPEDVSEDADKWIAELEEECKEEEIEVNFQESDSLKELDSLIGLDSVKMQVKTLRNFVQVMQQREAKGLKTAPVSYHCVFTGNPGTGKTTVARIVAQIYKELGILKKGHLVETDRSGLVAEYVGQTAVKTNKIIDKALDGVLFIDEAYSLFAKNSPDDYGLEAIATLLKRLEDDRDRLVVILAGYTEEMKYFMEANPGLKSRFNRYIEFPDYSAKDLYAIFLANIRTYEYNLTPKAQTVVKRNFSEAVARKDRHFGNGRYARNVFEKMVECQANRVSKESNPDIGTLMDILPSDVSEAFAQQGL